MRQFFIAFFLFMTWLLPATATAQHIPPGLEKDVLKLFEPYGVVAPADQVTDSVVIDSIIIDKTVVRVTLFRNDLSARLNLSARGSGKTPLLDATPSFDLWLAQPVEDEALAGAVGRLVAALKTNDTGTFWSSFETKPEIDASQAIVSEIAGSYFWFDFIGEFLLLALLLLFVVNRRQLTACLRGHSALFWAGLFLIICLGTGYRIMLFMVEEEATVLLHEACDEDSQCDDFNRCTSNQCIDQECTFAYDPPDGDLPCCRTDADCAPAEHRCLETFCAPDTSICAQRTRRECNIGPYAGQSRPPSNTSVGWFYGIPAKILGNTTDTATQINLVLSSLSILLLALFLLAWQATAKTTLGATLLYAVLPASLASAQTMSMTGFLITMTLLLLLSFAPLVRLEQPATGADRYPLAALVGTLFFILASARPDAFVLLLPMGAALLCGRAYARLDRVTAGILAAAVVLAFVSRLFSLTRREFVEAFPTLALESLADNFLAGLDVLLFQGVSFPFLLFASALVGAPVLYRANKHLFLLCITFFLAIPIYVALFQMTQHQIVRYALVPAISLVTLGGCGLQWLGTRKIRFAWLAMAILVAYFCYFPISRTAGIKKLMTSPTIVSHFFQL